MDFKEQDIDYVAKLAHLHLTEDERKTYRDQLAKVLGHIEKLNKLDTANVEPLDHVLDMDAVFREDEVGVSIDREKVLEQAPKSKNGFFLVPPVIE